MTGNIWKFSHLVDDEDLLFAQKHFVTYLEIEEYYGLSWRIANRIADKCGAVYKIGRKKALIRRDIFEEELRRLMQLRKEDPQFESDGRYYWGNLVPEDEGDEEEICFPDGGSGAL